MTTTNYTTSKAAETCKLIDRLAELAGEQALLRARHYCAGADGDTEKMNRCARRLAICDPQIPSLLSQIADRAGA